MTRAHLPCRGRPAWTASRPSGCSSTGAAHEPVLVVAAVSRPGLRDVHAREVDGMTSTLEKVAARAIARRHAKVAAVKRAAHPRRPCDECGAAIARPFLMLSTRPGWYCHVHAPASSTVPPPPAWEPQWLMPGQHKPRTTTVGVANVGTANAIEGEHHE